MLTRIAPTPSGFLHEGNLVNFLLTKRLAARMDAGIVLRIDDMDRERTRPEYVSDIFRVVEWLGIEPTATVYLSQRTARDVEALHDMHAAGMPTFVCRCSRSDLGDSLTCTRHCDAEGIELATGASALRLRLPDGPLRDAMGDVVLWRRDGYPAYQLSSLVADHDFRISHIVRGEDLRGSTVVQLFMARFLDDSPFLRAQILHHPLIVGESGAKLSKSQGTSRLELTPVLRNRLDASVASIELS
jgi:glutamyl-tRNA synthetase